MSLPPEKGVIPSFVGGLGNQMWILAAAYSASEYHNCPLYIPKNTLENNRHNLLNQDYNDTIFKYFGTHLADTKDAILTSAKNQEYITRSQPGFHPWSIDDHSPGSICSSYYQFYPPLEQYETQLRELFCKGLQQYRNSVESKYDMSNAAFLHVRRGDYVVLDHIHFLQPIEYYKTAVESLLNSKSPPKIIYIFSDDYIWITQQSYFTKNPIFQIVDSPNELETIAHMSLCESGAICANSTFSWWGAFLGSHKTRSPVYVPKKWMNEPIICLFPNEWIVLDLEDYTKPFCYDPMTSFVTLCDASYYPKAKKTIEELRTTGRWKGSIVLITVDFTPEESFRFHYNILHYQISHISTDTLVEQLKANPIKAMADNRHFGKLYQWDKFYVFHEFFRNWKRVIFLDAGIRILDSVQPLLDLDWKGKFLAPDDSDPYDNGNRFACQLDLNANPAVCEALFSVYPENILNEKYFLNCMFVYDTELLTKVSFQEMVDAMNKYPICLCNEMGIMNLFFTFKLGVWEAFPQRVGNKYLFGWNESNYHEGPSWNQFHFMKYPRTI